jgi:hydantoinase/carbamoylase family amidase
MSSTSAPLTIDRDLSARRIADDVATLTTSPYTSSDTAIRRYAYTPEYRRTLDWFIERFGELGYGADEDPVGNLVLQRAPAGTPVFGLGSHCDSNRNGGPWDGTLGVVIALEVCRLAEEHGLDLPLRVISWLEEEGSGFGQLLLGSRVSAGSVTESQLREEYRALDDGRPFWDHALDAGLHPERWRECARTVADLGGWIECHIEQGRVLEDAGERLGIVETIAGMVHADINVRGRADHAGATPMNLRVDAMAVAAEITLELERLSIAAGKGTVGVVGELDVEPGLINVVPGATRLSLDIRGTDDAAFQGVAREIAEFAQRRSAARGARAEYRERSVTDATPMDPRVIGALHAAVQATGVPHRKMPSGAVHDTISVARSGVPCAMLFVPCREGLSHTPEESADPADAAIACEVVLNAVRALT